MAVGPFYTIHQYREDMFKVVRFKGDRDPDKIRWPSEVRVNDQKLDSNFSRARSMVLQYALCNPWDWFFTGTLDPAKFDRFDLDGFMLALSQFIRDKRKAYGVKFQVLLIPEHHKDGATHVHGMIYGLPGEVTPRFSPPAPWKLVNGGFHDWPDYRKKFGFCSLGRIKDPVATAYYITKYITKDLSQRADDKGKHLYFHSRPLRKSIPVSDVYCYEDKLENVCTEDYDFCKVGMVRDAPWWFPYQFQYAEDRGVSWDTPQQVPQAIKDPLEDFDPSTIEPDFEQLCLF